MTPTCPAPDQRREPGGVFDVAVIGGGPAGCAAALSLVRAGLRVVLLEKTRYENRRIGEGLPPAAAPCLARLGLPPSWPAAGGHLPSPGTVSHWGGDREPRENDHLFSPYGSGWHLDRAAFDRQLAARAEEAGARVFTGAGVAACRRRRRDAAGRAGGGAWDLSVGGVMGGPTLCAHFVILATGRAAGPMLLSNTALAGGDDPARRRSPFDSLVALVAYGRCTADREPSDRRLTVGSAPNGWWYAAPLPGGEYVFACLTDADLLRSAAPASARDWYQSAFEQAAPACARLGIVVPPPLPPRIVSANSYLWDRVAGDGWAAAGDAAVGFDPLSSRGILRALEGGQSAAAAAIAHLSGDHDAVGAHEQRVRADFLNYLWEKALFYEEGGRRYHTPFWERRRRRKGVD